MNKSRIRLEWGHSPCWKSLHGGWECQAVFHVCTPFFEVTVAAVDYIDEPDFEDECQDIDGHQEVYPRHCSWKFTWVIYFLFFLDDLRLSPRKAGHLSYFRQDPANARVHYYGLLRLKRFLQRGNSKSRCQNKAINRESYSVQGNKSISGALELISNAWNSEIQPRTCIKSYSTLPRVFHKRSSIDNSIK